jgi:hypothetical protein
MIAFVLAAMVAMPVDPPKPDPLGAPLTPQTMVMSVERPCPDGSVLEVRLHEMADPPYRRIAFLREGRVVGILDTEGQRVWIPALHRAYPLADDVVPVSPCDLPDPGTKT